MLESNDKSSKHYAYPFKKDFAFFLRIQIVTFQSEMTTAITWSIINLIIWLTLIDTLQLHI
jgi:hypothetical protein